MTKNYISPTIEQVIRKNQNTYTAPDGSQLTRYNYPDRNSTSEIDSPSWTYDMLVTNEAETTFRDYRARITQLINPENNKPFIETLQKFNIESRVGIGSADTSIGQLPPYYSNSPTGGSPQTKIFDTRLDPSQVVNPPVDWFKDQTRDLVRFRFQIINNDNPNFGTFLVFRATFSGFSDTYNPQHTNVSYIGRGEEFKTYLKTNRTVSFNFQVIATSKSEMKIMWQKLNTLASSTYGDYKQNKLRGTYHKVTIGDYLENQPCVITSLSYSIPDDSTWVIALDTQDPTNDNGISRDEYTLPKYIDVSVTLDLIHNFLPKNSLSKSFFVLPNESIKNSKENLNWVNGDLAKLEDAITSNTIAPTVQYTSQYKSQLETKKENLSNLNNTSIQNANNYRNII
jgi:hypothetical protein